MGGWADHSVCMVFSTVVLMNHCGDLASRDIKWQIFLIRLVQKTKVQYQYTQTCNNQLLSLQFMRLCPIFPIKRPLKL